MAKAKHDKNVGQVGPDYGAIIWAFFDIEYYSHTFSTRSDSGAPMEYGKQRFRYKDNYPHRSQGYGQDDYRNFSTTCREVNTLCKNDSKLGNK